MAFAGDIEAAYYDAFVDLRVYSREAAELRRNHPDAVTVLEIGAGTGLMTAALERRGFIVTPLEPSAAMTVHFRGMAPVVHQTIQEFEPGCRFDLVIAHCDVLNYVPFRDIGAVLAKMKRLSKRGVSIRTWDPALGVKGFRYRRRGRLRQVRVGFVLFRRAHMFFLHWGIGPRLSYHRLYLHNPEELCP